MFKSVQKETALHSEYSPIAIQDMPEKNSWELRRVLLTLKIPTSAELSLQHHCSCAQPKLFTSGHMVRKTPRLVQGPGFPRHPERTVARQG